jgi:tetratricopeptide (TPR) repeat protein
MVVVVQAKESIMRLLLFIGFFSISLLTLGMDYQSRIYQAYLDGEMNRWKYLMQEMESTYQETSDLKLLEELVEAQYGYVAYCISVKRKKEARKVLNSALNHLDILIGQQPQNARFYTMQGALFGLKGILEPVRILKHAHASYKSNQIAYKLNPFEPHVWMEKANREFYAPSILGRSKLKAIPHYRKAVRLFEANPHQIEQNWIYLNCLAGLGLAYEHDGQWAQAANVYEKLLELEPTFRWIRDELYPGILEKQSLN